MLVFGGPGGPWEAAADAEVDTDFEGESHHDDDEDEDAEVVGEAVGEVVGEAVDEAVEDGVGSGSAPAAPTDTAQPATSSAGMVSPAKARDDLSTMYTAYRVRRCRIVT